MRNPRPHDWQREFLLFGLGGPALSFACGLVLVSAPYQFLVPIMLLGVIAGVVITGFYAVYATVMLMRWAAAKRR